MHLTALLSLPFALTESWFYPEYWRPYFLFDLAERIGFGIEDFLFVAALGAFTAAVYPFSARRRYVRETQPERPSWRRLLLLFSAALAIVLLLYAGGVPVIYGACIAMFGMTIVMLALRADLWLPAVIGGASTLLVYAALCHVFQLILPGVFELAWNTEQLSNRYVFGIPLEELLYGFSAGFAGAAVYPFFTGQRLEPMS
jgi:hypothetical protein